MIPDCHPSNPPPAVPAWFCEVIREERCMPPRHRYLWPEIAALIRQESGFREWALRDETAGREVGVRNAREAVAYAEAHPTHKLGAGLGQITGVNLTRWFGKDWRGKAFRRCEGVWAATMHFVTDSLPRARAAYNGAGAGAQLHAMRVAGHLERITGAPVNVPVRPSGTIPNACGNPPPAWASWQQAQYRACIRKGN